jgi:uncharacterized membrane protein YvbJ
MSDDTQACPDCGSSYLETDNYCRQCGMYLAALRPVPMVKPAAAVPAKIERERASLPAPVKKAATALAIGTALQIGVGLAGKYVASQAARQVTRAALSTATKKPARVPEKREEPVRAVTPVPPQDTTAVSETVMIRRVWIRRSQ